MSKANYNKKVVVPLVKKLLSEKKFNEKIRKKVERQQGQVLIYSSVNVIKNTFTEIGLNPDNYSSEIKQAWAAGREKAKQLHISYTTGAGKDRLKALKKKWKDIQFKTKPNPVLFDGSKGNTFLVSNFKSSLIAVKKAVIDKFTEVTPDSSKAVLSKAEAKAFSRAYQRGHGEEGLAVSQVQIAEVLSQIKDAQYFIEDFEGYIQGLTFEDKEEQKKYIHLLQEIKNTYTSLVDEKGNLLVNYFSIVRFQPSGDNAADQKFEKGLIDLLKKFLKSLDIVNIEHSPPLNKKLKGLFINTFESNIKPRKQLKVVKNKTLPKPGKKSSGAVKKSLKQDFDDSISVTSIPNRQSKLRKRTKTNTNVQTVDYLALKALINAKLPATVRQNMGYPALVNRTGRFAASTQVTDITETAKGFPSIGYTYMKFPYQTFEQGFRQGSADRDPRALIDRSIRDIVKDLLAGRFYTRRM